MFFKNILCFTIIESISPLIYFINSLIIVIVIYFIYIVILDNISIVNFLFLINGSISKNCIFSAPKVFVFLVGLCNIYSWFQTNFFL